MFVLEVVVLLVFEDLDGLEGGVICLVVTLGVEAHLIDDRAYETFDVGASRTDPRLDC